MKYECTVLFDASRSVTVDADSPEEADIAAMDEVGSVMLCHHCSDEIEVGDAIGTIIYAEGKHVAETGFRADRVARLEAEIADLKARLAACDTTKGGATP